MKSKNIISSFIFLVLFAAVFVVSTSVVFAAPAPEFFVINEENKQCGIYWPGDEFSQNGLPSGWEIYEPEKNLVLKTPFGTCNYKYDNQEQYYQQCCSTLGFKYVNYTNISYTSEDVIKFNEGGWKCSPRSGKDYYQGILVNEKSKECTSLIDFFLEKPNQTAYPTEGQCTITDKNWVAYEYQEKPEMYEYKITTPFGECNNLDTDACCKQLGLTNVGRNLGATTENGNYYLVIVSVLALLVIVLVFVFIIFKKRRSRKNSPPSQAKPSNSPRAD